MRTLEKILEWGGMKRDITLLILSGIALLLSLFDIRLFSFDPAWIAIVLCGIPIILEAAVGLITAFDIKADLLVSLALIASLFIGEVFAAGEVAFIMQLGALLEEMTVARARAGIEKLVHLTPTTARIVRDEVETIIPAEDVQIGDLLRVQPGETVPVDGVIVSGQTSINQAVMTGESLPVDKTAGDEVSSGTVNQYGAFEMRAARVGEDSSIQRMIRLVQSADAGKAKIVGLADRWATWIVVTALTAAVLTWLIAGEIIRAVTILVVFCPCALVLATPTAIMAAIGNATRHGFLVREGDALERLAGVKRIAFDKTGTLTYGKPAVVSVKSFDPSISEAELFRQAACAELLSEHPLGKAVVNGYREQNEAPLGSPENFSMLPGLGVRAEVGEESLVCGNARLMSENGVEIPEEAARCAAEYLDEGCTIVHVASGEVLTGILVLSDTLREDSMEMIRGLKACCVCPLLLSGDNERAARATANRLGIHNFRAECLPEDKMKWIRSYEEQGEPVLMIGDGINDAPALKAATVGIAMGGVGSDIAVEAADIALVDDEIKELPHLLLLSKRMMRTIRHNLTFSMTLNFIAIALAIAGVLGPVVGALVHNAGSVAVIINSALLLRWKSGTETKRPALDEVRNALPDES